MVICSLAFLLLTHRTGSYAVICHYAVINYANNAFLSCFRNYTTYSKCYECYNPVEVYSFTFWSPQKNEPFFLKEQQK